MCWMLRICPIRQHVFKREFSCEMPSKEIPSQIRVPEMPLYHMRHICLCVSSSACSSQAVRCEGNKGTKQDTITSAVCRHSSHIDGTCERKAHGKLSVDQIWGLNYLGVAPDSKIVGIRVGRSRDGDDFP